MSGTVGLSPINLYVTYAAHETTRAAAALKADPQASALAAYFKKVAPTLTSPAALLKDYKALTVVLTAFGLQGSIGDTAIIKKLLTQYPTSKTSLAQTLGNAKYALFANALSNWTTPPFSTASAVNQLISSYGVNLFEQSADQQAPGLANALAFTREAPSLTKITEIQSDTNLLAVAVTGSGLPLQNYEELGFDQQTAILTSKLKVADLQKPTYVTHLVEQYLVEQSSGTGDSEPSLGSTASLYDDGADTTGDSILSILNPSTGSSNSGTDTSASAAALSLLA